MRLLTAFLSFLAMVCVLGAAGTQSQPAAPAYDIVKLSFEPAAINDAGEIAGAMVDNNAGTKPVIWSNSKGIRFLGSLPDLPNGRAVDINAAGDVAGYSTSFTSDGSRAFIYRKGKLTALPGGTRVYALNDSAVVVGESYGSGRRGPTVWHNATPHVMPNCCGGAARAINKGGLIGGDIYDREGRYHAFTWDEKHPPRMLPFSDDASSVRAINQAGHMIVYTPAGYLLVRGSEKIKIGTPEVSPTSMNDHDQAVGDFGPNPFAPKAFYWDQQHGRIDLNTVVPPDSGWKLERAVGINNRGQIVGTGDYQHQENVGFLLEPRAAK